MKFSRLASRLQVVWPQRRICERHRQQPPSGWTIKARDARPPDGWILPTRDNASLGINPTDGDRRFFVEHSHRRYRIRPAWAGEVEALGCKPPAPGLRPWVLVVLAGRDVRLRVPLALPEHERPPDTEATAEAIARQTPALEMAGRVRHALTEDWGPAGGTA
jgi:hypothetical protein